MQFIQRSVKVFFVQRGLSALDDDFNLTRAESSDSDLVIANRFALYWMSRTCIRYLAMEIARSESCCHDDLGVTFHLLRYATTSWVAPSIVGAVHHEIGRYSGDCPPSDTNIVYVGLRY